jgi:hypothetical protein
MLRLALPLGAVVALGVVLGAPARARAQAQADDAPASQSTDAAVEDAKNHFDEGQSLYLRAQYDEAALQFMAAYKSKPFPAFLYNAAVAYERGSNYPQALSLYKKYLAASPASSPDHDAVQARITALQSVVGASSNAPASQTTGSASQPTTVVIIKGRPVQTTKEAQAAAVQKATAALPKLDVKGLVIVESDPPGATVYVDDAKGQSVGKTPWEGSLTSGKHTVFVQAKGFKQEQKDIEPSSDKMIEMYFALSQQHYLGWVQVTGNVPGASVYLDDKQQGSLGSTPFTGFLKPGKHTIIVARDGYADFSQPIEVKQGAASVVTYSLQPWSYGMLSVSGDEGDTGDTVYMDGAKLCEVPCKDVQVQPGEHKITVERDDMKDLDATITAMSASRSDITLHMQPTPSRFNAYFTLAAAVGMTAGALYVGKLSKENEDSLNRDLKNGNPQLASNDPRFSHGKWEAISADGLFGAAFLTGVLGTYYLFRDVGPASTADLHTSKFAVEPELGPGLVGLGASGRF